LKHAGFSAKELREADAGISDLKQAGFSATELRGADFDISALRRAGFSAKELRRAGFGISDMQGVGLGSSVRELREAGFAARELRGAGFEIIFDWSTEEIRRTDLSGRQLREAGITAFQLAEAGFVINDLAQAGFSCKEIRVLDVKFNAKELQPYFRKEDLEKEFTSRELSALAKRGQGSDADLIELELGYHQEELWQAGWSLEQQRRIMHVDTSYPSGGFVGGLSGFSTTPNPGQFLYPRHGLDAPHYTPISKIAVGTSHDHRHTVNIDGFGANGAGKFAEDPGMVAMKRHKR